MDCQVKPGNDGGGREGGTMHKPALALAAVVAVMITAAATLALAQTARYPSRTIEIVVAYGPGGSTDLVARALA
jgi:tripartite-type tricarboxylate transporter receptor subunit TctC